MDYTYDGWGNITSITDRGNTSTNDDNNRTTIEYIRKRYNSENGDPYLCVPEYKKVLANYDPDSNTGETASEIKFYYDNNDSYRALGSYGLLTKMESRVNGNDWIAIKYVYDVFDDATTDCYGNLTAVWDPESARAGNGIPSASITYDDDYKTYVTSETNALGILSTIQYNDLMFLESVTDANNVTGHTSYDVFGRVTKSWVTPDTEAGPTAAYDYIDTSLSSSGVILAHARLISKVKDGSSDGYLVSYTYFDGLGRTIQVKTEDKDGKWRTADYFYDENGRNYRTSVVYRTQTSAYTEADTDQKYTKTIYDSLGRVIEQINTDCTSTRYVYEIDTSNANAKKTRTITIDPDNHVSVTEVCGNTLVGKVYKEEYPYINYGNPYNATTVHSSWNGSEVIDNDGNRISTVTDMLGRKLSYSDPDMGTWTYDEYDDNGNPLSQTDARGNVISWDYDVLNRVRHKYYNGVLNSTYLYDGNNENGQPEQGADYGFCKGRITKVIYPDGRESQIRRARKNNGDQKDH